MNIFDLFKPAENNSVKLKKNYKNIYIFICSALTEQIVRTLPLLNCPHSFEPHQIQGLDAAHILPVVKVNIHFLIFFSLILYLFILN